MKKFKKMLVALCLCVCVALSVGLVGCADSKTLAEIDDLKAKIEQKDTTIAEKDATIAEKDAALTEKDTEIDNKNSQIKDLTLSAAEKFGIMATGFEFAENRSYIDNANANVFLVKKYNNKAELIEPSHSGSMMESKISTVLGRYLVYGVDESYLTIGKEMVSESKAEDGTYSKDRVLIEYSKNKYSYSTISVECAENDETQIISILEEKYELELIDGRFNTLTREHRYQQKVAENQVVVNYWKGVTYVYQPYSTLRDDVSTFHITSVDYTTNNFNLSYDPTKEDSKPTDIAVAVFSGLVQPLETENVNAVIINYVTKLYGITLEDNADASGWGIGSEASLLIDSKDNDTSESGAFNQAVSVMGKKIYEAK